MNVAECKLNDNMNMNKVLEYQTRLNQKRINNWILTTLEMNNNINLRSTGGYNYTTEYYTPFYNRFELYFTLRYIPTLSTLKFLSLANILFNKEKQRSTVIDVA